MTELPSPKPATAQEIFHRTARQVYFEFTARSGASELAQKQSVGEFCGALSAVMQAAKPWLDLLGTQAFSAYLSCRAPTNIKATGDAFGLEVICVSLTNGLRYSYETASSLNQSLITIFRNLSKQVSYQDICAIGSLKNISPVERALVLQASAAVLAERRSEGNKEPVELQFLINTLISEAAKNNRQEYLQNLCKNPAAFWASLSRA